MTKYLCWCPEQGETREDGGRPRGDDAQAAAEYYWEEWCGEAVAMWNDGVVAVQHDGIVTVWNVCINFNPTYHATERKGETL